MIATQSRIEDFLSSNKTQFIIPVYQRNYDWTVGQCKQLLDDILEVGYSKKMNAHFIGSIVYIHDDAFTTSRIKELTIIDGQQRLTTLTLIYLALYRLAKEINDEGLVDEISETYLINKFATEEEKLKLRPTENNDKALKFLLRSDETEEFNDFSKLIANFDYFKERINEDIYRTVLKGLSKLMFVEVSLERGKDDPQRIFESLNSTGLKLEQGDLIRNYILMGLNPKDQNKIYQSYWEIIEKLAKDDISNESKVSDFIRDYLTLENRSIPNKGKVYLEFKAKYPTSTLEELEANLLAIKSLVKHYNKLINPKNESDKEIRLQLEHINRLEINVVYPFLMKVYDDYFISLIDKATFIQVLDLIQSFCWRRFIVGLPTSSLNKIFMSFYKEVDSSNYLFSIQKALLKLPGKSRFPKNKELIDSLKIKDVYNIKSKNRTYLLEKLENFENREPVMIDGNTDITIEHIFPQNPDPKWKIELGTDDYNYIKENYLNTIGNLTLSGNNGKLGNKPFIDKRDLADAGYKDSRLWLNKYLTIIDKWDKAEIERRFDFIAERVLKIWDIPNITIDDKLDSNAVNIFDAEDPTFKKLEYAIFFDNKIEVNQVAKLYIVVFKQLFDLQPETFFTTEIGSKIGLTKDPEQNKTRSPAMLNDTYYIDAGYSNKDKFDRIKLALTTFDFEDELMIKYAEEQTTNA
jgi:uncharacterized protein with ParB-like and HNH nuclease domain